MATFETLHAGVATAASRQTARDHAATPEPAIGVDVGGTKIAAALVTTSGAMIARSQRDTPAGDGDAIVASIVEVVRELHHEADTPVPSVGIGIAGMVDAAGTVVYAPNLALQRRPVGRQLQEQLHMPLIVANDANVATWGEFRAGAARDVAGSIIMLTLGTGVGGGVVVEDRLALGTHGMGAEFGHIIVHEGGRACPCGNQGCLEAYASGKAIATEARQRLERGAVAPESALHTLERISGRAVTAAARGGDGAAIDVLATCGFWLGVGIATLINALDPVIVVIGGGAMQAGDMLLGPARMACAERVLGSEYRPAVPIVPAVLGSDAGAIGAALLAMERVPAQPHI